MLEIAFYDELLHFHQVKLQLMLMSMLHLLFYLNKYMVQNNHFLKVQYDNLLQKTDELGHQ